MNTSFSNCTVYYMYSLSQTIHFTAQFILCVIFSNKRKMQNIVLGNNDNVDSFQAEDDEDKATIYVSGFKESCTKDSITLFFENKRRCGGSELREGKKGFTRLSPTVARLTYVSLKGSRYKLKG